MTPEEELLHGIFGRGDPSGTRWVARNRAYTREEAVALLHDTHAIDVDLAGWGDKTMAYSTIRDPLLLLNMAVCLEDMTCNIIAFQRTASGRYVGCLAGVRIEQEDMERFMAEMRSVHQDYLAAKKEAAEQG